MIAKREGLTVVEVLVAITIIGVVIALLSTITVSSVRHDATSGARTQAVQVLSYLGRLAAVSDPTLVGGARSWDYGELKGAFKELAVEANRADPSLYRASVAEIGEVGIGAGTALLYRVQVCWRVVGEEHCVDGDTAGPDIPPAGVDGPDPVVN